MKTRSLLATAAAFAGLIFSNSGAAAQPAGNPPAAQPRRADPVGNNSEPHLRFEQILWRQVQNQTGEALGTINDLLVHMPEGRIVFVAVLPAEDFGRPKAVPPGALMVPEDPNAPLKLEIAGNRWKSAPVLDWNGALVIEYTEQGEKVYGYYQQPWLEPPPALPWAENVAIPKEQQGDQPRYVSLKKLEYERLLAGDSDQMGYVHDFLLDWSSGRVTHALVSPQPAPVGEPDETWFAVPVVLLGPSTEYDALSVERKATAFREAAPAQRDGRIPPEDTAQIYRYPAAAVRPGRQVAE